MSVKAYLILKGPKTRKLPDEFRSLTGPYLFRCEAEKFARAITTATGEPCQISTINLDRVLSDVVKTETGWTVSHVWNIRASEGGLIGDTVVKGKALKVERVNGEEPWKAIEPSRTETAKPLQSGR